MDYTKTPTDSSLNSNADVDRARYDLRSALGTTP